MRDDRFEWDDRKAASNLRKHELSFELARLVFDDPHAIEEPDDEVEEERWQRIGLAQGRLLTVVHTFRGSRIRIISARKADSHEQDIYFTQR